MLISLLFLIDFLSDENLDEIAGERSKITVFKSKSEFLPIDFDNFISLQTFSYEDVFATHFIEVINELKPTIPVCIVLNTTKISIRYYNHSEPLSKFKNIKNLENIDLILQQLLGHYQFANTIEEIHNDIIKYDYSLITTEENSNQLIQLFHIASDLVGPVKLFFINSELMQTLTNESFMLFTRNNGQILYFNGSNPIFFEFCRKSESELLIDDIIHPKTNMFILLKETITFNDLNSTGMPYLSNETLKTLSSLFGIDLSGGKVYGFRIKTGRDKIFQYRQIENISDITSLQSKWIDCDIRENVYNAQNSLVTQLDSESFMDFFNSSDYLPVTLFYNYSTPSYILNNFYYVAELFNDYPGLFIRCAIINIEANRLDETLPIHPGLPVIFVSSNCDILTKYHRTFEINDIIEFVKAVSVVYRPLKMKSTAGSHQVKPTKIMKNAVIENLFYRDVICGHRYEYSMYYNHGEQDYYNGRHFADDDLYLSEQGFYRGENSRYGDMGKCIARYISVNEFKNPRYLLGVREFAGKNKHETVSPIGISFLERLIKAKGETEPKYYEYYDY